MQSYLSHRVGVAIAAVFMASTLAAIAPAQEPPPRAQPLPARIAPTEYPAHAQVGKFTIAADFAGHGIPTPDATFATEGYVVVEVAFFGPDGARLNLSFKDFSLRVNGKKAALAAQPYESIYHSLSDPSWEPPVQAESKGGSTSIGGSGSGNSPRGGMADTPPAPPKMPLKLALIMEQKVKTASLPEGERTLPAAGFIYFSYGGKTSGIHSMELTYDGAAGKVKLPLQ
jgi:hypothetical protein